MDFIVDNYLWFIVGGTVVLMIIIGFIAEKTDFGRKPFNQNKKEKRAKNKKVEDSDDEISVENNEEEAVVDSEFGLPIEDAQIEDTLVVETDEVENDLEAPIEEVLPENTDDQLMPDLDVPELSEVEEATENDLEVVEDIVADDSEDDVWKF